MMAFCEVRFYNKTEKFLLCLHLEDGCVVVAEMIIRALPKVSARQGAHFDGIAFYDATFRLTRSLEIIDIQYHSLLMLFNIRLIVVFFFTRTCHQHG